MKRSPNDYVAYQRGKWEAAERDTLRQWGLQSLGVDDETTTTTAVATIAPPTPTTPTKPDTGKLLLILMALGVGGMVIFGMGGAGAFDRPRPARSYKKRRR